MKNIVNNILDRVFSFSTLFIIMIALTMYALTRVVQQDQQQQEEYRLQVAACYNVGMVRVESEAGPRCALPSNLPAIK